jgi:hypothetical protein
MTGRVLQFRPKRGEADACALSRRLFEIIAGSNSIAPATLVAWFRTEFPDLTLADLPEGFAYAERVIKTFKLFVVALDRDDNGGAS